MIDVYRPALDDIVPLQRRLFGAFQTRDTVRMGHPSTVQFKLGAEIELTRFVINRKASLQEWILYHSGAFRHLRQIEKEEAVSEGGEHAGAAEDTVAD